MESPKPGIRTIRVVWVITIILVLIGIFVVVRRTLHVVPIMIQGYNSPVAVSNPALAKFAMLDDVFAQYPILTFIHILPGLLYLTLGALQFNSTFRKRHLQWHRRFGRISILCGMITGITALVMSFMMTSIGGVNQAAATVLFGFWFLFALGNGLKQIMRRNISLHREWMIRAYSIGLAIATIRPIIGIFFATSPFSGLTPYEFFGTGFWIGFVLHLIAAEVWIQLTRLQSKSYILSI